MSEKDLTSVAYKKGNWMRYTLWGLAAVCIAILFMTFFSTLNGEVSASVPEGYRFAVTDNYADGSKVRTTYYVYDDQIFVEDESFEADSVNRTVMVYDNVKTASIVYNPDDVTLVCELGSCSDKPKALAVIKSLISRKIGREYLGF